MKRALTVLVALGALVAVASAATIVGGGKSLTATDPNFQSDKIVTGGGGGVDTDNLYDFTFTATFLVCDVTVRQEDENGKEVVAGGDGRTGMTSIHVTFGTTDNPKTFSSPVSSGKIDLTNQVPAGTSFHVKVQAKSKDSAVKFSMSFSTKPPSMPVSCTDLGTFEAGTAAIVARPILQDTTGLLLPVHNNSTNALTFARFEMVGSALTAIDSVIVPDKSFTVTMDGNYAFTLTGDSIPASQTIQVYVILVGSTTARAALIATFNQS